MGYAQEYHVERYLRECLIPRIAPVSGVSPAKSYLPNEADITGNDTQLYRRKSPGSSKELLTLEINYPSNSLPNTEKEIYALLLLAISKLTRTIEL